MTDETTVARAVRDWAGTLLSIPASQRYAYPIGLKGAMPDVVAFVQHSRLVRGDPAFPFPEIQQAWLLVYDVELSIMVAKGDTDGDAQEVEETLQGYGKALRESAVADATLGNRVEMVSRLIEADYSAPPVTDEGGIKGRPLFVNLHVGELAEEPA